MTHKTYFPRLRVGLLLALLGAVLAAGPLAVVQSAQAATPYSFGIICENENPAAPGTYFTDVHLTTKTGYISIPDGNTVFMWGYAYGNGATAPYQHPGPTLCFNEDQVNTVSITLHNTLPQDVSIIFPGQSGVTASGGAPSANSLAQAAPATNGTVTYTFKPSRAGSFIYESGTNLQEQVQMGLFGALIVRPTMGTTYMYDWNFTRINPFNDYMMLLSEIDPDWHAAVEAGLPFDVTQYHPRYWQINGRSFPDTIAPNKADWLPTQPYGALLHIHPSVNPALSQTEAKGYQPYPSAVRIMNVGMLNHPIHPHGNHVTVVGRDGHALQSGADPVRGSAYDKFDVMTGAGQVWDTLYSWTDVDGYNPYTHQVPYKVDTSPVSAANPAGGDSTDTILNPHGLDILFKDLNFFSGSPYLGFQANKNDGTATTYNECGEYYQIWHSHALNEAANYEAGFGGMITLERIDPVVPAHGTTCSQ